MVSYKKKYIFFYKIINIITKKKNFILKLFLFYSIYFIDIINNKKIFFLSILNFIYLIFLYFINNILKKKYKIKRPFRKFNYNKKIINISEDFINNLSYSFPSNHSLICNNNILIILNNIKNLKYVFIYKIFILSYIIDIYSRLILGMHHINDIKFYINFSIVLFYLFIIIINKYLFSSVVQW